MAARNQPPTLFLRTATMPHIDARSLVLRSVAIAIVVCATVGIPSSVAYGQTRAPSKLATDTGGLSDSLKYWIFLRDKLVDERSATPTGNTSTSTIEPTASSAEAAIPAGDAATATGEVATPKGEAAMHIDVHPRALRRRELRSGGGAASFDIPVSRTYAERLEDFGVEPLVRSRWLNAISAYMRSDEVDLVRNMDFVVSVRPVGRALPASTMETNVPLVYEPGTASIYESHRLDYGTSATQLSVVNALAPIEAGVIGTGVVIGFLDTTFGQFTHPVFNQLVADNRLLGQQNFAGAQTNSHGMSVASVAVGFSEGNLVGPAYGASVFAATTEFSPTETNQEEDNYVAGIEWLESQGVDVISSSLGYSEFDVGENSYSTGDLDGDTGVTTRAADIAVGLGIVFVNSAGNEAACGSPVNCWYRIVMPADGDSVIAVGGVDAVGTVIDFSSRGPTADGRIKPDVSAMGQNVQIALTGGAFGLSAGTSFSAPMVSGIVAQMLQVNPNLTPIDVRDILRSTASQSGAPDNTLGWGIVDANAAVNFARLLSTGDTPERPDAIEVMQPYPNPASDRVRVSVLSLLGDEIAVSVYDLLGRRVASLAVGGATPGRHDVMIELASVPAGLYHVVATSGASSDATTFTVVR